VSDFGGLCSLGFFALSLQGAFPVGLLKLDVVARGETDCFDLLERSVRDGDAV